jgi:3-oxoacyl-[acyl-carrier-protein] synthase-3
MAITVSGFKLEGICGCVPKEEIDNREYGKSLFGDDLEGIIQTLGISKRRVCKEKEVTSLDLCMYAAKTLFEGGNFDPLSFGGIVFVTQTPDLLLPNNATFVQSLLGFSETVAAFDINLACSGYPYGLYVAGMMAKTMQKRILLMDGDTHSHFVSPYDRTTALLFGDAGSATVVAPDASSEASFLFHTLGESRKALHIQDGGYRNRVDSHSCEYQEYEGGNKRRPIDMYMDGMAVFDFVAKRVPKALQQILSDTGKTVQDLDWLVLHQANLFMIKQVAKKIKMDFSKVPTILQKFGNSSSTTIPLTIASELSSRIKEKTNAIMMSGFGGGLSIGTSVLNIGPCYCPGVVEYES